jgi:hypothetical protein
VSGWCASTSQATGAHPVFAHGQQARLHQGLALRPLPCSGPAHNAAHDMSQPTPSPAHLAATALLPGDGAPGRQMPMTLRHLGIGVFLAAACTAVASAPTQNFLQHPEAACEWFAASGLSPQVAWTEQVSAGNRGYVCQYVTPRPGSQEGLLFYGRASIDSAANEVYISISVQAYSFKRREAREIMTEGDLTNFATIDEARQALLRFAQKLMQAQGQSLSEPVRQLVLGQSTAPVKGAGYTVESPGERDWATHRMVSLHFTASARGVVPGS